MNLDIKNMEYINLDDGGGQQQSGELEQQSGMQESIPDGEDIQGFGFLALIQRRPKLVGELTKLRAMLGSGGLRLASFTPRLHRTWARCCAPHTN